MAATPKHSVSVAGIVVRDDGRVLVIKRDDNGHWEAPGGESSNWMNPSRPVFSVRCWKRPALRLPSSG